MKHEIFENEKRQSIQRKAGWITNLTQISVNRNDTSFFESIMNIRVQNRLFVNRTVVLRQVLFMFEQSCKKIVDYLESESLKNENKHKNNGKIFLQDYKMYLRWFRLINNISKYDSVDFTMSSVLSIKNILTQIKTIWNITNDNSNNIIVMKKQKRSYEELASLSINYNIKQINKKFFNCLVEAANVEVNSLVGKEASIVDFIHAIPISNSLVFFFLFCFVFCKFVLFSTR